MTPHMNSKIFNCSTFVVLFSPLTLSRSPFFSLTVLHVLSLLLLPISASPFPLTVRTINSLSRQAEGCWDDNAELHTVSARHWVRDEDRARRGEVKKWSDVLYTRDYKWTQRLLFKGFWSTNVHKSILIVRKYTYCQWFEWEECQRKVMAENGG